MDGKARVWKEAKIIGLWRLSGACIVGSMFWFGLGRRFRFRGWFILTCEYIGEDWLAGSWSGVYYEGGYLVFYISFRWVGLLVVVLYEA